MGLGPRFSLIFALVKQASKVKSARHEHALEVSLVCICHAVLHCARVLGESIPDEGVIHVDLDDSIVVDTAAEKAQGMAEVGTTMAWEYRTKWCGEDEQAAGAYAREVS